MLQTELHTELLKPEIIREEATDWLRRFVPSHKKVEVLELFAKALSLTVPKTGLQRDLTEKLIEILPDASRIDSVATLEALSTSFLWIGTDYIPNLAQKVLMLEKSAITTNPERALIALEKILVVCHCALIPLKIHGTGKNNDVCTEWQRQTFLTVLNAIETNPAIDPSITANVLRIAEMITYTNDMFSDLNKKIHFITLDRHVETSTWH